MLCYILWHGEETNEERQSAGKGDLQAFGSGQAAFRSTHAHRVDPHGGRPGRQLGSGDPLLAGRAPNSDRDPRFQASDLRPRDSFDTVERIGCGIWERVFGPEPLPHDASSRGVPRPGDRRRTVTSTRLEPLRRNPPSQDRPSARVLRRDVPHRAMERPHAQGKGRRDALRADRPLTKARRARPQGTCQASGRGPADSRPGLSRSVLPRLPRTQGHLQREGPRSGHPPGDGAVHPRTRRPASRSSPGRSGS